MWQQSGWNKLSINILHNENLQIYIFHLHHQLPKPIRPRQARHGAGWQQMPKEFDCGNIFQSDWEGDWRILVTLKRAVGKEIRRMVQICVQWQALILAVVNFHIFFLLQSQFLLPSCVLHVSFILIVSI